MRFLPSILALGLAFPLLATEVTWINDTDALAYWAVLSNWQGVTKIPTNGEDVVFAPLVSAGAAQVVSTWGVSDSGDRSLVVDNVSVGKLTGDVAHTLEHATRVSAYSKPYERTFAINDASGFSGLLKVGQPKSTFRFPLTTSAARLSARNRVTVDVPNGGSALTVGALEEGGALVKKGAGELVLTTVADKSTLVYADEGTLTLGDGIGTVRLADESVSVGVTDGKRASVRNLVVGGSKFVKTGGGTLVIDRMTPESASVEVRGGAVAFERMLDLDEPAAAENAALWLDASKLATMDPLPVNAGDAVQAWKDCRADVNRVASNGWQQASTLAAHSPTLVKDAAGAGLHALSLGADANDVSWIRTQWWRDDEWAGAPNACAGFIVYRPTTDGSVYYKNILGSSTLDLFRNDGWKTLVCPNYAESAAAGSLWTMDGTVVDPWDNTVKPASDCNRFRVMAFSSPVKLYCNGIAKVHGSSASSPYAAANSCGGIQVCEFIVYDRPLTEDERVRTEAYLMKKWLGRDHPAKTVRSSVALSFALDLAPVVETDSDLDVSFTGGNGAFVKKGEGTLTLDEPSSAAIASISVLGGGLSLPVGVVDDEVVFHFDASDEASLETRPSDLGNGQTREEVTTWRDTRNNGLCAVSVKGQFQYARSDPALVSVETAAGIVRPMIDFGTPYGATGGGMTMNGTFSIRDAMTIFADAHDNTNQRLFTSTTATHFYRRTGDIIAQDATTLSDYQNGYIAVNREETGPKHTLEYGVPHLISFAPTGTAKASVNSIANDRNSMFGGCLIGEQIAFGKSLSAARREYWEKYLMWKWFGDGEKPTWADATFQSIVLGNGARLSLVGTGALVQTSKLAGWGAVAADDVAVADEGELAVEVSPESISPSRPVLSVSGALNFGTNVRFSLLVSGNVPTGRYPLVTADALGEIDLENVTVVGGSNRQFDLERVGRVIYVSIRRKGLTVLVR